MNTSIVELNNVVKRYGPDEVVFNLSFSVARGECVGLLGPNGAGKTSTLRMMTGQAHISGGEIRLFGTPVNHRPRAVRARFGVVTQDDTLDEELTAYENLLVFASYFGLARAEAHRRAEDLLEFVHLEDKRDVNILKLSGGMRRRLLIARALVNAPDLVILDEPTTGLDPQARHLIWQKLRLLKRRGSTMLLTTHYMEEAEQLCDRLLILEHGRVMDHGSPRELIAGHVGVEVIELRATDIAPAQIRKQLGIDPANSECSGDTLFLFLREAGAVPPELREFEDLHFLHRRATLEDVFLRLTGRDLRE